MFYKDNLSYFQGTYYNNVLKVCKFAIYYKWGGSMNNKLTNKELNKLRKIFSDEDIEKILYKFGVDDVRKVINNPYPNSKK